MSNSVLQDLLIEYDKKKARAEFEAENKTQEILDKFPDLASINKKINIARNRICKIFFK